MRIGILAGSWALLLAVTWPIYAQTNSVGVIVDCPDLSGEQFAQVMVMVRAGLLAPSGPIKRVRLTCEAQTIAIEMEGIKGQLLTDHEPKALLPGDIAEQLIALVDRLDTLARKWDLDGNSAAPLTEESTAASLLKAPGLDESTAQASPTNGGIATSPMDQAATRKARAPRPISPLGRATSVRLSGSFATRRLPPDKTAARRSAFGILAGAELDPLDKGMRAILGPRLGATFDLNYGVKLSAILGLHFGLNPARDFDATDYRAGLYVTAPVHPLFVATGGLAATLLYVRAPAGLNQAHDTSVTPALQTALAYRPQFGQVAFELGPIATFYARPRSIRVDGNQIFSVPILLVGVIAQTTIGI